MDGNNKKVLPARYCPGYRLLPISFVMIQLPKTFTSEDFTRGVMIEGSAYRFILGGSNMKPEQWTVDRIFNPSESGSTNNGYLYAVPATETRPYTALSDIMTHMFPFTSSYYYGNRLFFPTYEGNNEESSGAVAGNIEPVGEGNIHISSIPDQDSAKFKIKGDINLRVRDGCGFIKQSAVNKLPVFIQAKSDAKNNHQFNKGKLPAAALQHYPTEPKVVDEVINNSNRAIIANLKGSELYYYLTTGNLKGDITLAIPSKNGKNYFPNKILIPQHVEGILMARSPYPKPNIQPITRNNIITHPEDPTVKFLNQDAYAFQYSLLGYDADSDKANNSKGILVEIPDHLWPQEFGNSEIVLSEKDLKATSHGSPGNIKEFDMKSILYIKKVYPPGSISAVNEQHELNGGDYDGDQVLILADNPELYRHIEQFERNQPSNSSLKPPKVKELAIVNGNYNYDRADQILSTRLNVLNYYTSLLMRYLSLSKERQRRIATLAVNEIYTDSDEEHFSKSENGYVNDNPMKTFENFLGMGILVGTDSYKTDTGTKKFSLVSQKLYILFHSQNIESTVPL